MSRALLVAVSVLMLAAGCARNEAPSTAAPQSAAGTATSAPTGPLPPPLLNTPGDRSFSSNGSGVDCPKQCEREHSVCMDSQSARSDVTSGTMFESRMFGPAARCEDSLRSCLKRCTIAAPAPAKK